MNEQDLFNGVADCIRRSLGRPLPDLEPQSRLVADCGADSLDFLDLVFLLEQHFQVRLNPREIERKAQADLGGKPLIVNEAYTSEAMAALRAAMPEVPSEELYPGLPAPSLAKTFRVQTFMNLVQKARQERDS